MRSLCPGAGPACHARSAKTPRRRGTSANVARPGGEDADELFGAIVKLSVQAVPDARSSATLGSEREGTGVVIGDDGLILTIGYLIVEADDVSVTDSRGRTLSARIVGYDHAIGIRPGAHDRADGCQARALRRLGEVANSSR